MDALIAAFGGTAIAAVIEARLTAMLGKPVSPFAVKASMASMLLGGPVLGLVLLNLAKLLMLVGGTDKTIFFSVQGASIENPMFTMLGAVLFVWAATIVGWLLSDASFFFPALIVSAYGTLNGLRYSGVRGAENIVAAYYTICGLLLFTDLQGMDMAFVWYNDEILRTLVATDNGRGSRADEAYEKHYEKHTYAMFSSRGFLSNGVDAVMLTPPSVFQFGTGVAVASGIIVFVLAKIYIEESNYMFQESPNIPELLDPTKRGEENLARYFGAMQTAAARGERVPFTSDKQFILNFSSTSKGRTAQERRANVTKLVVNSKWDAYRDHLHVAPKLTNQEQPL